MYELKTIIFKFFKEHNYVLKLHDRHYSSTNNRFNIYKYGDHCVKKKDWDIYIGTNYVMIWTPCSNGHNILCCGGKLDTIDNNFVDNLLMCAAIQVTNNCFCSCLNLNYDDCNGYRFIKFRNAAALDLS